MITESPLDRIYHDSIPHTFSNACWAAICTMSTVGYGDIYPKTSLGRIFGCMSIIFGIFLFSVLVVTLHKNLEMSSEEGSSYTVLRRLNMRERLKKTAIKILLAANKKCDEHEEKKKKQY